MSENEGQDQANLWKVFDIYKSAGVLDEGLILENIAFYALYWRFRKEIETDKYGTVEVRNGYIFFGSVANALARVLWHKFGLNPEQVLLPTPPKDMREEQQMGIFHLLVDTFENIPDLGEWFDQYLIPRMLSISKGGRYATPRHLIDFMADITGLNQNDSLADFACGTGGMLVSNGKLRNATGVEISPNMARLAFTNLILHGQKHNFHLGNAFEVFTRSEFDEKFDVVLMNPPWGVKLDPYLVHSVFSGLRGKSETLFTALAYESLNPGGRMAIMVPSGLLFSTGRGEISLREYLVRENALQAIVSLPRAIENVSTHILVATKPKTPQTQARNLWIYRPRFDGFMGAKNPEPNELNDLPLVQIACNTKTNDIEVNVIPLIQKEKLLGYQISTDDDTDFIVTPMRNDLLIEVTKKSEVVELIHTAGEKVYRGKNSPIPLPKISPKGNPLQGKYAIKTMVEFISNETPSFTALFEPGKGEIRKGGRNKSRFGVATKDEVHATGILLNKKFQVASSPFPIVLDKSVSEEKPTYFMLFEGDEKEPVGLLAVLYDGLNGVLLQSLNSELFLCDWNKSRGEALFYMPSMSMFLWNNSLSFKEDSNKGTIRDEIFRSDKLRRGVMFTVHSQILGIYVNRQEILNSKNVELQPERYWIEKQQAITTRPTAQILGEIKKKQNSLTGILDQLLSISEIQALAGSELPPRLKMPEYPAENLKGVQQSIWRFVQTHTEQANGYATPKPFQSDDIKEQLTEKVSVKDVQSTLELFERMGLIVAVSYEGVPYFRLPEERDLVAGEQA